MAWFEVWYTNVMLLGLVRIGVGAIQGQSASDFAGTKQERRFSTESGLIRLFAPLALPCTVILADPSRTSIRQPCRMTTAPLQLLL